MVFIYNIILILNMIRRVWRNNFSGQNLVTIPDKNEQGIVEGDWVKIQKVVPKMIKGICKKCGKRYVEHTIKEVFEHKINDEVIE